MIMKKLFFTTMIAMITMSVSAAGQKGDMAIGGNLLFGAGQNYSNVGLGAKFSYNVTDPIRLLGEFDYFFEHNFTTMLDFSVYGHYLFPVADRLLLFPAVGVGMMVYKTTIFNTTFSDNRAVFSLGGGAEFLLTDKFSLLGEFRLKLRDGSNRSNFVLGIAYKI